MSKVDENDRARAGTLPSDPSADTERARPHLRVAGPEERRTPADPCDLPAERALLGALLWAGQNQPETVRVAALVDLLPDGTPFYDRRHAVIYAAARACADAKQEHDPVAVHAQLVGIGADRLAGGLDHLRELVASASTVSERQLRVYAQSIRATCVRRCAIAEAHAIIEAARNPKNDHAALVERANAAARGLAERSATTTSTVSLRQSLNAFFSDLETGKNPAISTGFRDLDNVLNGGFRRGETTVVAARPTVGKSLLVAQIAETIVSDDSSAACLYVTLEMSHKTFSARLIAARSGVHISALRRRAINPAQWSAITRAVEELRGKGLYFADSASQTMASIYAAAVERQRALRVEGQSLSLVVIDHLGIVKPSAEALKRTNREQQVAEISRATRFIAAELNCHVIGITHISREGEKDAGRSMPQIRHLRESGAYEQDADNILILHREKDPNTGVLHPTKPPALAVAKARNDETGCILLGFDGPRARFFDHDGTSNFHAEYGRK